MKVILVKSIRLATSIAYVDSEIKKYTESEVVRSNKHI